METPSLRIRLEFEDRSILSRTQRSDGMNRSWLLIKPQQHGTISDVCTHLLHIFELNRSCPNGILLSMEGFVLPPRESTEILKDKEVICVKKKRGSMSIEGVDAGNMLDDAEVDEIEPVDNGLLLLENDNSDKKTGESQSESEEADDEQSEADTSPGEAVSKKRKASTEVQNSKKKKRCLGVLDDNEETNRGAGTSNKMVKSPSSVKRSEQRQENVEEVKQVPTVPGDKKVPSRSARRKKAKRQWMREVAKISKKKPHPYPKHEASKAENKEADGRPKGLLHWKQAPKRPLNTKTMQQKESDQNGDTDTEVVPVITRPGHIRFGSIDDDQTERQTGASNGALQWSGASGKKKGQRWGTQKFATSQRNNFKNINKEALKRLITDTEVPVIDPKDFDKLPPCCSPKEGDVIAYRLLELSSSWTPEFSSFRVGRILYYDARNIILIPVPEYPLDLDNIDADGPNDSPYSEDGTLEINYSALVDVRNIKQYGSDAKKAVGNGVNQSDDKDAAENLESNDNINKSNVSNDPNPGDEGANPWERSIKARAPNNTESTEVNPSSTVANKTNPLSDTAPGPSNVSEAKSPDDKNEQKSDSSFNQWLNPKDSEKNNNDTNNKSVSSGRANVTTQTPEASKNDNEKGGNWGRPWSSFVPYKPTLVKQTTDGGQGSSVGRGGRTWGRGRGRRGRGRGRG